MHQLKKGRQYWVYERQQIGLLLMLTRREHGSENIGEGVITCERISLHSWLMKGNVIFGAGYKHAFLLIFVFSKCFCDGFFANHKLIIRMSNFGDVT